MLVPYLRDRLMTDVSEWRNVYFIPAVVGVVVCFIALMCARETDAFIESRLSYLRKTPEELEREKKAADAVSEKVETEIKYEGYISRQQAQINEMLRL